MPARVLVALSGGVDSAITAFLLQQKGYEVEGAYMILHNAIPGYHEENLANIDKLADRLGIKTHILDFSERFAHEVFGPFVKSYCSGETPNPCALCNRGLKFGAFYDYAKAHGFDKMATGHYVRTDGRSLQEAYHAEKDQSYFLFGIRPDVLPDLLFPLGEWQKSDIKEMARQLGLDFLATQRESHEICFVKTDYIQTLKEHDIPVDLLGEVTDEEGRVIGRHKGYLHYTIGKRKGFQVPGAQAPLYVKEIDAKRNRIVVTPKEALACQKLDLAEVNLFEPATTLRCSVKIRYRTKKVPATVHIEGTTASVLLDEAVYGVALGQACVFYEGERVIGGGWIVGA